jgi:predicted P-loop ATPase
VLTPKPPTSEWLQTEIAGVPADLRHVSRWLLWTIDGNDQKVPRSAFRPDRDCDANKAKNWASFDEVVRVISTRPQLRLGFALGGRESGATIAGVDLDHCRNPLTGEIESWAREIITLLNSYTEVSPSRTGVKIFVSGDLPEDSIQGKVFKLEIYDRKRYFAVTGHHLPGTPTTVQLRREQLQQLFEQQRSKDLVTLAKLFDLVLADRTEWIDIRCPWRDEHSTPDGKRDAALHRNANGEIDGFECFHASHKDKTLGDIRKLFGLKSSRGSSDFISGERGIVANSQENIRRALQKLEVSVWYDAFQHRPFMARQGATIPFDEATVRSLWLQVDAKFGFLPSKELFFDVLSDLAHNNQRHPVKDYLNGLTWDRQPRLDRWLITYGGADDSEYVRAVAGLVLVAAVRRIRQPGCKFHEMLVLISKQGLNKSSAVQTLCPNDQWFASDFPLNVDAKQVIERTGGKWIVEASELEGLGKRDLGHLKSMLSRPADGPVRLAYDRLPTEVPRQFVAIGTTNLETFLKDTTGNRRFWPVKVKTFDVEGLRRDRDQLWAEAAAREATGASIRLAEALWPKAEKEQEKVRRDDPWEDLIAAALPHPKKDYIEARLIWDALGKSASQLDNRDADRVENIMQRLGYAGKKRVRIIEGHATRKVRCWIKEGAVVQEDLEDDE